MQIHAEYTLYGHFFYLKHLLGGVEKLRFFLDQDSGMRAACLAAFQPEMASRRADAFYVRIAKEMTIAEKRAYCAHGNYRKMARSVDVTPVSKYERTGKGCVLSDGLRGL